jgi:alkylhydroperoxidase/carboxymuconolactone decarboxylase family protein YurZ
LRPDYVGQQLFFEGGKTMTSRAPGWRDYLGKSTPDLLKQITDLQETATKDGALSLKTKTLMTMLCDALLGHNDGVANIARRARSLGASDGEIAETVGMAFLMGGLPGLVTGANAFRE